MSSSFEKDFCGGAFWNTTLTWDSEHPDFTKCFHKTILSWCPIIVLLFFSSLELPSYFSSNNPNRKIPWSPLTIIKLCATSGLVIVNIAEFILIGVTDSDDDPLTDVYPVDYITASVSQRIIYFVLLKWSSSYNFWNIYSRFMASFCNRRRNSFAKFWKQGPFHFWSWISFFVFPFDLFDNNLTSEDELGIENECPLPLETGYESKKENLNEQILKNIV